MTSWERWQTVLFLLLVVAVLLNAAVFTVMIRQYSRTQVTVARLRAEMARMAECCRSGPWP